MFIQIIHFLPEILWVLLFVLSAGSIAVTKYYQNKYVIISAALVALLSLWFDAPDKVYKLWNTFNDATRDQNQLPEVIPIDRNNFTNLPYPLFIRLTPELQDSGEVEVDTGGLQLERVAAPEFGSLQRIPPLTQDHSPQRIDTDIPAPPKKHVPSKKAPTIAERSTETDYTASSPRELARRNLVKDIQIALIERNCLSGEADGIIGSKTKAAIINFNRTNKVGIDWNTLTSDDIASIVSPMAQECASTQVIEEPVCYTYNGEYYCD